MGNGTGVAGNGGSGGGGAGNTLNGETRGGSARTSATCSLASSRESSTSNPGCIPYRVLMLGGAAVGKSSLVSQFMTSEYLHAYDTSIGECSYTNYFAPLHCQFAIASPFDTGRCSVKLSPFIRPKGSARRALIRHKMFYYVKRTTAINGLRITMDCQEGGPFELGPCLADNETPIKCLSIPDFPDDESGEKTVSVLLSGEESELIFIDHSTTEMSVSIK